MKTLTPALLATFLFTAACIHAPKGVETRWHDALPRESWAEFKQINTDKKWFEVYQLTENTYAVYEPYQWQEALCYLLIGSEKALLVDTLQGIGDLKAVIDQLTDLPVIVINTHSHSDHMSGNYQFETIYGVNTPFTHESAKGHPPEYHAEYMTPDTFWKNIPVGFKTEEYHTKPYQIDQYVHDGQIIELGDRPVEVVFVPGHSPDSLVLVDSTNRMMLTGDTFYPAPIYLYLEESSFQDFIQSVQKMLEYKDQVDFLLPGHNETMQSADYLVKLLAATLSVLDPATTGTKEDGYRNYSFDSFHLRVKDPLDYAEKP